jgi:phage-related protein
MFTLKLINEFQKELELTHKEDYKVTSITGLNPPGATISTSTVAGFDGERYNSSRLNKRNVVITVVINENVAKNLDEFNKLLLPKRYLKISYATKEKNVYIEGYIESFEYDHFSNKVKCQISVVCPKPYWRAQDVEMAKMSPVVDLFEFPFSIPAEGIAFGEYVGSMSEYFTNPGNVETGVLIDIEATKKVKNPLIVNATTGQQMKLLIVIDEGDHITINTERGNKSIILERNGEKTNVLNTLDDTSEWLRLAPGSNRINYNADSGADNMLITIKCPILYGGV